MTHEEPEESSSSEEEDLGKTQRMQTGKQLKTNTAVDESINQSAAVAQKRRAIPAFI